MGEVKAAGLIEEGWAPQLRFSVKAQRPSSILDTTAI